MAIAAAHAGENVDLVRAEIHKVLSHCPAWRRMEAPERQAFAQNMLKVGHFLAQDPGWLDAPLPPGAEGLAEAEGLAKALAPVDELKGRLAKAPGQVGETFKAGAVHQGVEEFRNLVDTVDFPEFVSGLIQGVFQAIVDASIQQMQAYGELLAATAKSVGEFANDHISDDQVRQQIANRHPGLVKIERTSDGGSKLVQNEDAEDLTPLKAMARTTETISITDDASEQKFVTAAKLEMARQRQKLMALMVMLGINRIVVTNGRINAKVVFDITASDYAKRMARADMQDMRESVTGGAATYVAPWGGAGGYHNQMHKTTVRSSIDDTSESKAEMKARLTGEVRVNFKSETLPPERMLDALQLEQINYLSQPGGPPASAAAPSTAGRAATAPGGKG
jgi:hypothetical protein